MSSARLKQLALAAAAAGALGACANMMDGGDGMATKTAEGIPLGRSAPHPVQPLPDRPRFGQLVSEADLAA
jgi:hypothetical protein